MKILRRIVDVLRTVLLLPEALVYGAHQLPEIWRTRNDPAAYARYEQERELRILRWNMDRRNAHSHEVKED